MKTQLSSLDIAYVVKELKALERGRIDKIFQKSSKEFYIQLHVSGMGKQILRVTDKAAYLTAKKPAIEKLPGFCMFLRKHLSNSRVKEIRQKGSERIMEIVFETKEGTKKLVAELFGGGNLLLLDENATILSAARYEKYKNRDILPKSKYTHPKMEYNFFDLKQGDMEKLLSKTEKESIVKCLAVELGMGGTYAEETCLLAGIDKNKKPCETIAEIAKIEEAIKKLLSSKAEALIFYKGNEAVDVVPFPLQLYTSLKARKFESFNEALDYYFSYELKDTATGKSPSEKKLERLGRIIEEQKRMIEGLEKSEKENREKAELIYNNYALVKEILDKINEASKKHSWGEIKDMLKRHKIVKGLDTKEKKVTIEL
jgi:predicted ribosome quality control (RQC) complex YloA/Tae2 family protein